MGDTIARSDIMNLFTQLRRGDEASNDALGDARQNLEAQIAQLTLLRTAIDQLPDEFFLKGRDGAYIVANRATDKAVGLVDGRLEGKSDQDVFDDALAGLYRSEDERIFATGQPIIKPPHRRDTSDGAEVWVQASKFPIFDEKGEVSAILGQVRQSTDAVQSQALLNSQIDVLQTLAANRPIHEVFARIVSLIEVQLHDVMGSIVVLNDERTHVATVIAPHMPADYGDQLVGLAIGDNVGSCGTACYTGAPVYTEDVLTDPKWAAFLSLVQPFGFRSCWSVPFFDFDGKVHGSFALYSNRPRLPTAFELQFLSLGSRLAELAIERDRTAEELRRMAERDSLTGLPNRRAFVGLFADMLSRAEAERRQVGLGFIDFDDFKLVNDRFGHSVGDAFLLEVSQRLARAAAPGDLVARLGGDEFVVVMQRPGREGFQGELQRLLKAVRSPVETDRHSLTVAVSGGLSLYPVHAREPDELLAFADTAMHRAKLCGRNRIEVYDPEFSRMQLLRRSRIDALRAAIFSGGIDLDFQPLMRLDGSAIFGFEALARWNYANEGRLSPAAFIPLAEEEGLIVDLGQAVLTRACREAKRWGDQFGQRRSVSVNVSAQQFVGGEILQQVRQALTETGVDPSLIEIELTESMLLDDEQTAIEIMTELKSLGLSIAIDDFGTGFSNLGALARLPVDRLKIDRSIIRDIETNDAAASIASAIIAMGQRLGLKVLAEGVETCGQLAFLRANDCESIQGYLLGRPMPSSDLDRLLEAGCPVPLDLQTPALPARSLKRVRRS